jgi:hypothetical protein
MKKIVTISPVSSPVVAEAVAEAPALVAEVPVEVPVVAEAPAVEDPCDTLRALVEMREAMVETATKALTSGFSVEALTALNSAVSTLNAAKVALATKVAEVNAATFIPSLVTHLGAVAKDVPHSVWGATVRFEITFTSEGTPSVRRIAQAPTYSPSGGKAVTRNRSASVGRDGRLPSQGWWFASSRIVIRISDDSDQVVAWTIGGTPSMFGSISSACTKLLGTSTNGYAYTNLGSTEDRWSDSSPRKGWSCGEMPQHLKPATF